jgi:hypothetical protein
MRTMAYCQWNRGSTYLSFLTLGRGGGGKYTLVVILLATTLSIIWAQFQLEELYNDVQVNPAPERIAIDFGRIADGYPLTDLSMCVRSGRVMIGGTSVALFTSLLGGQNETYYIAPGDTLELSAIRRSYWHAAGVAFFEYPTSFNLVGRTLFELRYRNRLPEASREILRDFYGWSQQRHRVEMNYLSFLVQRSFASVRFPAGNWAISVDLQTRLCHTAQNASLGDGCAGVVGNENCSDILGQLRLDRNHTNTSSDSWWFDPPHPNGLLYHRSWRAGTVPLDFEWGSGSGTASVRTPPSGASVECNRLQLTESGTLGRLRASSETYKGLILMRRRAFPDGTRSLDPLGIPELGENELVFRETPSGVQLKTALSAWMLADPPESFLLRIPFSDGGELVLADQVEWFSNRLFWRTSNVPFQFSWNRYGYVPSITQRTVQAEGETVSLGKIFIWNFAEYNAQRLPDYNPAINTNVFGKQVAEMLFRPASNAPLTVVGRANYEVFFPAVGTRHPGDVRDVYTGNRAPNWFYYYMRVASHFWRQIGEAAGASLSGDSGIVLFTTYNPYSEIPGANTSAFYDARADRVFIRNSSGNYQERTLKLFKMGVGECNGQPVVQIVSADQLQVRGIHAFLSVLYHELGHRWLHTNSFVSCRQTNAIFPIVPRQDPSNLDRDRDNDGLDDEWEELNGLCPFDRDTTGVFSSDPIYAQIGGDKEVVAEIYAYRYLMATESSPLQQIWLWRHDWSDKGLQFGNPVERFSAFPWRYNSTGTRFPRDTQLLISLPKPLGGCR